MATYKIDDNSYFINPYNFIPMPKERDDLRNIDAPNNGLLYGYLICHLKNRTPLAVPDVECKKADENIKEHYYYPFFTIQGKPTIPGSSIRGMIRAVYETVTNSCMSTLSDDCTVTKRVEIKEAYKPGIIVLDKMTGKWELFKANRYIVMINDYKKFNSVNKQYEIIVNNNHREIKDSDSNNGFRYGNHVWFKTDNKEYMKNNYKCWSGEVTKLSRNEVTGYDEGYVYLGERTNNKHGECFY